MVNVQLTIENYALNIPGKQEKRFTRKARLGDFLTNHPWGMLAGPIARRQAPAVWLLAQPTAVFHNPLYLFWFTQGPCSRRRKGPSSRSVDADRMPLSFSYSPA